MNTWTLVFWICGGTSCVLFILQSVFWTAMRFKKIPVPRWTVFARRLRIAGLALLIAGGILWYVGYQARAAAWIAVFGGGLNVLVSTFHLAAVAYMTKPPLTKKK